MRAKMKASKKKARDKIFSLVLGLTATRLSQKNGLLLQKLMMSNNSLFTIAKF